MSANTTWRELLEHAMKKHGETTEDVTVVIFAVGPVKKTADSLDATKGFFDQSFDSGYGLKNGRPFRVWTDNRVYFPADYDGSEWVESVSRHPWVADTIRHIGCGG